jgi:hypothetical protein
MGNACPPRLKAVMAAASRTARGGMEEDPYDSERASQVVQHIG